jgi:DNA repair protein SbcC/Rad50
VWIETLDVRGYRRLRGVYRFGRGLNIVVGDNETGKSSLHDALIRTLFGFSRQERRRQAGESEKDRRAPWTGGDFGIVAIVHDSQARTLRVEWDFASHTVRVLDAATGADRSAEVRGRHGDVTLGSWLLGLDLAEFRQVCCLDQAAISAVERTENLVLALQQAVERVSSEGGVDQALDLLNEFLRTELGVHTQHLTPLPRGRLATLQHELEEQRAAVTASDQARQEIAALAAVLADRDRELAAARERSAFLEQQILLTDLLALDGRCEHARRLEAHARNVPASPVGLPERLVEQARARFSALKRLGEPLVRLRAELEASREWQHQLERRQADLQHRLDLLEPYAQVDIRHQAALRELRGRRQAIGQELDRAEPLTVPPRDPLLARYRAERAALLGWRRTAPLVRWDATRLGMAAVVWTASVALGAVVHPAFLAGLLLALVLVLLARPRRLATASPSLEDVLAAYGAQTLEDLDGRLVEEDRRIAAATALVEERACRAAAVRESRGAVEHQLIRLLDAAGVAAHPDPDARVQAYLVACDRYAERQQLLAELESSRMALSEARQPLRDLTRREEEHQAVRRELAALLGELGIDAADLDAAEEAMERLVARARVEAGLLVEAAEARAALAALLGPETIERLEERRAQAAAEYEQHVARHGSLASLAGDRQSLATEQWSVRQRLREAELQTTELRTRIRDREEGLGDVAALKERMADLGERMARMEQARDAIRIAREALREAATETHRAFAPHLNRALARNLATITDGRYRQAVVDEDLRIQVEAPETGRLVPVDALSRGTQDQIYLIERLEIVRLLTRAGGNLPLWLDDPFARFDAVRLRLALQLLRDVAAERQVVLFSEDVSLIDHAQAICDDCTVLRLPSAAARAVELSEPGKR